MSKERTLEIKRLQKQQWRDQRCPMSSAVLYVAQACWWVNDRDATMARGWLAMKYTELQSKKDPSRKAKRGNGTKLRCASRLLDLPANWEEKFATALTEWSAADETSIRNRSGHWAKHVKQAEALKLDAVLISWTRMQNEKGRAVSSRAILNRKRDVHAAYDGDVEGHCLPLPKKAVSWVRRWALRSGLRRGRFAQGECFTTETKVRKVLMWQRLNGTPRKRRTHFFCISRLLSGLVFAPV